MRVQPVRHPESSGACGAHGAAGTLAVLPQSTQVRGRARRSAEVALWDQYRPSGISKCPCPGHSLTVAQGTPPRHVQGQLCTTLCSKLQERVEGTGQGLISPIARGHSVARQFP